MPIVRRIYVSLPADSHLTASQNALKWGVVEEIEKLGYVAEVFTDPRGGRGIASARAWNARDADEVARRCHGAAVLGFPRWEFATRSVEATAGGHVLLPTEFNHYEGALARTLRLPILVLVQRDVMRRVVFDPSYAGFVGEFAADAGLDWLHSNGFRVPFQYWKNELSERRDVFLGYCGKSEATAQSIKRFIQSLGATVLDWQTDFIPGRTILDQIQSAAARTVGGVFLFTNDDDLADDPSPPDARKSAATAVPRDNVVFEAGYFVGLKGKHNVLILRERGCKMPADLGGDIYGALDDRTDIAPIEPTISAFITAL